MDIEVKFPIKYDDIPVESKKIRENIKGLEAELKVCKELLKIVCSFCDHKGAKTGYNDRDGSWMNPCPRCGYSY